MATRRNRSRTGTHWKLEPSKVEPKIQQDHINYIDCEAISLSHSNSRKFHSLHVTLINKMTWIDFLLARIIYTKWIVNIQLLYPSRSNNSYSNYTRNIAISLSLLKYTIHVINVWNRHNSKQNVNKQLPIKNVRIKLIFACISAKFRDKFK